MDQLTLRGSTDTAHPHPTIPIYFIHSIAQPFCHRPGCWCQTSQKAVTRLFSQIDNREMTLQEAATLTTGEGGRHGTENR